MNKALFAGSFDPFTKGHKSIVDRALQSIADKVVIAVGINAGKRCMMTADERVSQIRALYNGDERVEVLTYDCLTTDLATHVGASFLLRGVRSVKDFEYERDIAEVNRRLTGIETVLMFTEPELAHVSSSIVRELKSYNKDITEYLP